MDGLKTYLRETRMTAAAFAKLIGVDVETVDRLLRGDMIADFDLAQRMIDATGGALLHEDFLCVEPESRSVLDLRSRFRSQAEGIDPSILAEALGRAIPALIGGARRQGDEHLPRLAADAAAHTYLALSTITSRRGPDRLRQALRPVLLEILEEMSAAETAFDRVDQAIETATTLYFQARPEKRRA